MSGYIARTGFLFQDSYLLLRVLQTAADGLSKSLDQGAPPPMTLLQSSNVKFGLEGALPRQPVANSLQTDVEWDVIVVSSKNYEFAELKSGAVTKSDRETFWKRIRKAFGQGVWDQIRFKPILVVNPLTAGTLTKWNELADKAKAFKGSLPTVEPAGNVMNSDDLLSEALWNLCNSVDSSSSPLPLDSAIKVLSAFSLQTFEPHALNTKVMQHLELIFPSGISESERALLLAWMDNYATKPTSTTRFFTVLELLKEVGIVTLVKSLDAEKLRIWRQHWSELPNAFLSRINLRLGDNGVTVELNDCQPNALGTGVSTSIDNHLLLGPGGAGKSAMLTTIYRAKAKSSFPTFICGADDIDDSEFDDLNQMFRFKAALQALNSPDSRLLLFVDGLDECSDPLKKRWGQALARLNTSSNISIIASVREAVWMSDVMLQKFLGSWKLVRLDLWPSELVARILQSAGVNGQFSEKLKDLLRTPILFDIYWRTFLDPGARNSPVFETLQTRHHLLSAYWLQRILVNHRNPPLERIRERVLSFCAQAANYPTSFPSFNGDEVLTQKLLSEGLIVLEGKLNSKIRFRHPLLRDFALGQWCLASENPTESAIRWNSIKGGLQRSGSLRAIFECLTGTDVQLDFPNHTLTQLIDALLLLDSKLGIQLAEVLGSWSPNSELDPQNWSHQIQSTLPTHFGTELVSASRLALNAAWAGSVEHWDLNSSWIDNEFAFALVEYFEVMLHNLGSNTANQSLRADCIKLASKIRSMTGNPKFTEPLARSDGHLRWRCIISICSVTQDAQTFAWLDTQLLTATWRVRNGIVSITHHLASKDPIRAAILFKVAIGLIKNADRNVLISRFDGMLDYEVIECAFLGENKTPSLLEHNPKEFLSVALELAEALWTIKSNADNSMHLEIEAKMLETFPELRDSMVRVPETTNVYDQNLDFAHDHPEYSYWLVHSKSDSFERCLSAINAAVSKLAKSQPHEFCNVFAPILLVSRLATVRSILLDSLLLDQGNKEFAHLLKQIMLDLRIYAIRGMDYWIEQGLKSVWSNFDEAEKSQVTARLLTLAQNPEHEIEAKQFASVLPATDLPTELLGLISEDKDETQPTPSRRPFKPVIDVTGNWMPIPASSHVEEGEWPDGVNVAGLARLHECTSILSEETTPEDERRVCLRESTALISAQMAFIFSNPHLLLSSERVWLLRSVTITLNTWVAAANDSKSPINPPHDFVEQCANIAWKYLNDLTEAFGEFTISSDGLGRALNSPGGRALQILDAAMTFEPLSGNQKAQERFETLFVAAFETPIDALHWLITAYIRPFHWFRSPARKALFLKLVWATPRHPTVLRWGLNQTRYFTDSERTGIWRILMQSDNAELLDLGQHIGGLSLAIYPDGSYSEARTFLREILEAPDNFKILRQPKNRVTFLRNVVFGMNRTAAASVSHTMLASDFANFALRSWRLAKVIQSIPNESETILLHATYWLREFSQPEQIELARIWWRELNPLLLAVVNEGSAADCHGLFFGFHDGDFLGLAPVSTTLNLCSAFVRRLQSEVQQGTAELERIEPQSGERRSWRECAHYVATTIDVLRKSRYLLIDTEREIAHSILSTLRAPPFNLTKAVEVLHRLQNE